MRICRRTGHDHLEPWHVGVKGLDRLRVVEPTVDSSAKRRPDHDGHRPVSVGAISGPRGLAHDLVEGGVDEVGELDLRDGNETVQSGTDRDTDDGRLGKRRVEHSRLAEAIVEAVGRTEYSPFAADV